jgi:hypothetical protein
MILFHDAVQMPCLVALDRQRLVMPPRFRPRDPHCDDASRGAVTTLQAHGWQPLACSGSCCHSAIPEVGRILRREGLDKTRSDAPWVAACRVSIRAPASEHPKLCGGAASTSRFPCHDTRDHHRTGQCWPHHLCDKARGKSTHRMRTRSPLRRSSHRTRLCDVFPEALRKRVTSALHCPRCVAAAAEACDAAFSVSS